MYKKKETRWTNSPTLLDGATTESVLSPSVTTTKTRGTASAAGRAPFVSENPSFTALVIADPVLVPPLKQNLLSF